MSHRIFRPYPWPTFYRFRFPKEAASDYGSWHEIVPVPKDVRP